MAEIRQLSGNSMDMKKLSSVVGVLNNGYCEVPVFAVGVDQIIYNGRLESSIENTTIDVGVVFLRIIE